MRKSQEVKIRCTQINLHRDKLNIGQWKSIKEYMQSVAQNDYTILLISEAYMKSSNCMYEVLEVMRNGKYKDSIFSTVIYSFVETIALLQKSNRKSRPDTYVKLSLNMEDYYRIIDQQK